MKYQVEALVIVKVSMSVNSESPYHAGMCTAGLFHDKELENYPLTAVNIFSVKVTCLEEEERPRTVIGNLASFAQVITDAQ